MPNQVLRLTNRVPIESAIKSVSGLVTRSRKVPDPAILALAAAPGRLT